MKETPGTGPNSASDLTGKGTSVPEPVTAVNEPMPDPWHELKQFTAARIALGSTGVSVPIREVLRFKLAHAHARDAVFSALDEQQIAAGLARHSMAGIPLRSRAAERSAYLQRPDLGRTLDESSRAALKVFSGAQFDIAVVIADGLSAEAVNGHAIPLLEALLPGFKKMNLVLAPVAVVRQGRVAIGDEIGEAIHARLMLLMIGERPGLSSPDSLGVYLTYGPRRGLTDESRNCISNIRPEGLGYSAAAGKILYLVGEAFRMKLTGVLLKEQTAGLLE